MNSRYVVDPERVEGLLLGAAVGDALGWPQEDRSSIVGGDAARRVQPALRFRDWERNAGGRFRPYREPVTAGTYSDDTQLLLAVGRACLSGDDWHGWLRQVELPFWPAYERGGGGAVLRAARAWAEGQKPWAPTSAKTHAAAKQYFAAGANGVAMRIAPHTVVTSAKPTSLLLLERCLLDGILTHGHPRALIGALVYAVGLRAALNGGATVNYGHFVEAALSEPLWRDPNWFAHVVPQEWQDARERVTGERTSAAWHAAGHEMEQLLHVAIDALASGSMANDERTLDAMGCFSKQRGAGTITAAAALYVAARTAARPSSGLLRTAFLASADTDTLASMTAAVLGAVHGRGWLGGLDSTVQDAEYISRMARQLAASPGTANAGMADKTTKPVNATQIKRFVARLEGLGPTVMPDGRKATVTAGHQLEGSGRTRAIQYTLLTADGQTLAIDVVSRQPVSESGPSSATAPEPALLRQATDGVDSLEKPGAGTNPDSGPRQPNGRPLRAMNDNSRAGLIETHLTVADLNRCAHFYLRVLGLPGERQGDTVTVAGGLVFLPDALKADATDSALCVLASDDVDGILSRMKNSKYGHLLVQVHSSVLHLNDPDGHRLRIVQV